MRILLPAALTALLISTAAQAQNDRFAYAITDAQKDGSAWTTLRLLDLQTGAYGPALFNGLDARITAYDAATRKPLNPSARPEDALLQNPFGNGVAAAAYDRKHHRLYFTPMFVDQLRYIDLRTMKLYAVTGQPLTKLGHAHNDEAKIITRMAIGADGYGYALSNDGQTFVRFSTGKKPEITALGALVDDPANKGISVQNRCTSFGGDMIADEDGNLLIFSARNNVFLVDPKTRIATHKGTLQGLPKDFTVNGAVVDAGGLLVVSSAVDGSAFYAVNPRDWQAEPYMHLGAVYKSSDLANSNILSYNQNPVTQINTIAQPGAKAPSIRIFPNPVTTGQFTLDFARAETGLYSLELTDITGRTVLQRRLTVNGETPAQRISLPPGYAKGVYLVKVTPAAGTKSVFEQKVMIQ
ncbi:MAG TPA: T9SS type A sorting domain-containing protein [Chitinophagaceae bacterium]|jgi:hypothetical protein|nr:T9SS type A sorting domain-containing protein [Chitinophagaceae bacterium]